MVRDGVVETPSQVWKTYILTVIRIPHLKNYSKQQCRGLELRSQFGHGLADGVDFDAGGFDSGKFAI